MNADYTALKERLAEINDLHKARSILGWDQQTKMPPRGAAVRAEQIATLDRIAHEKFTADETGRLLDALEGLESSMPYDSDEASLVRVTRRDWEKARRVPSELRAEMSREASRAFPVWIEARENSDFEAFLPSLRTNVDLRRRYIECFEPAGDPYDVVLDDYERDMTTAEVASVFERIKDEQGRLIADLREPAADVEPPTGDFPLAKQQEFELTVVTRFGYDPAAWRIDPTVHPFASGGGVNDIRITTRYMDDSLEGLFATMHETGHGLYEHGVAPELERTPLARGTSLGLHESQSRMWENLVGRSLPFWRYFLPRLREAFPGVLDGVELEEFYRRVNTVRPSLIRVEADEATYNMHIILRFELEQDILDGTVPLEELPEAWGARMEHYLGVEVPDDRQGVLQDVHWASGSIGYFPTYALGNVVSAQIWERIVDDIPDLSAQFEQGEFGELRAWLGERLYRHGRKFTPKETIERVCGGPLDPEPYLRYLREKLGGIYGLQPAGA
jgi:carboxypeptidase Taq